MAEIPQTIFSHHITARTAWPGILPMTDPSTIFHFVFLPEASELLWFVFFIFKNSLLRFSQQTSNCFPPVNQPSRVDVISASCIYWLWVQRQESLRIWRKMINSSSVDPPTAPPTHTQAPMVKVCMDGWSTQCISSDELHFVALLSFFSQAGWNELWHLT